VPDASFSPKALRPLPLAHDITASLADLGFALWAKGDLARAVAPRTCAGAINEKVLGPEQSRYGEESPAPWWSVFERAGSYKGEIDPGARARPRASGKVVDMFVVATVTFKLLYAVIRAA
jgi:hypothetical protein